ncbi:unnamed protein product [Blumeria hordei]|uniref:Membrane insertase YidC/Oxa/ALB C-terminal domain-containing protein n=2 Tax=Blumeria hordei TaxID=2867405 RepID=A0A383UMT0_BLUHO|nr:mitochondrial export translocase [Blumeria hordei DH14]SZF01008.1 unnamed protein product [Blumeria hordei]
MLPANHSLSLKKPVFSSQIRRIIINNRSCISSHVSQLVYQRFRSFHATTPNFFYHETLQTTHALIQSVHLVTGTSWSLTIPLVALLVRASTSLPIAVIQQKALARRVMLIPILQAWKHSFRKEALREVGHLGPKRLQRALDAKLKGKRKELFKQYNCARWKMFLGALQIPIFFGVLDVWRRMANMRLTTLTKLISPDTMSANSPIIPIEPDLATEGMLWFQNLLLADPQMVLPFLLSGTMLLNIFATQNLQTTRQGRWQVIIRRCMGVVALCAGPMLMHIPCVLLLYWISNSLLNFVQYWLIARMIPVSYPLPPPVPKRPWRMPLSRRVEARQSSEQKT